MCIKVPLFYLRSGPWIATWRPGAGSMGAGASAKRCNCRRLRKVAATKKMLHSTWDLPVSSHNHGSMKHGCISQYRAYLSNIPAISNPARSFNCFLLTRCVCCQKHAKWPAKKRHPVWRSWCQPKMACLKNCAKRHKKKQTTTQNITTWKATLLLQDTCKNKEMCVKYMK